MPSIHAVVMDDAEYSFCQGLMDRMSRDKVFSADAEKMRRIFKKDVPVSEGSRDPLPTMDRG